MVGKLAAVGGLNVKEIIRFERFTYFKPPAMPKVSDCSPKKARKPQKNWTFLQDSTRAEFAGSEIISKMSLI